MKSRQFCSVCKEWLEMEVVPTSDGEEDDGVIWFRCPQCQGFLPKLGGAADEAESRSESESAEEPAGETNPSKETADPETPGESPADDSLPWNSPADMMAAQEKTDVDSVFPDVTEASIASPPEAGNIPQSSDAPAGKDGKKDEAEPAEPLHEYIALLAEKDQSDPTPYRPWETFEVGQCILHQAWEDCGVVVEKEQLPGGRQVIKCFFADAGVVRLIEKAPR